MPLNFDTQNTVPMTIVIDKEKEKKEILKQYRALLKYNNSKKKSADWVLIRKAFDVAVEAHSSMRRKSGEPYIYHPIAVARITSEEIGLGTTSIVCALLHDVVEDTDVTLGDIENMFGERVALIIDGLTKISDIFDHTTTSLQAENFRKILLTLSEDIRVILIKLADRLHNMRTLGSMKDYKQRKIASETLFLYAPLAHRLGLYNIKSELEDLSLKYTEGVEYAEIEQKLQKTKAVRTRFINQFILPIKRNLNENGIKCEVKGRTKSVYSIWNKMKTKNVPFEEVYDIFAIRIIIDTPVNQEKADCWKSYSLITDYYTPNPDRLRDWISTPKSTGYESLHTTVMSNSGKWVEVQIRSSRMDEIAEKGFAAHWKYKESATETAIDSWISKIREMLENPEHNAVDFIDDFKLNLFSDEIYVFTPKGELKTLPVGATTLDFAFDIHTEIGEKCLGAKVNHKLVPLSHVLQNGDQIEIITANRQKPKDGWLKFVVTAKAKSKIKSLLKEDKRKIAEMGKEILAKKLRHFKISNNNENIDSLVNFYKLPSSFELFYRIAMKNIELKELKHFNKNQGELNISPTKPHKTVQEIVSTTKKSSNDTLVLGDGMENLDYKLSPCCNPIPGDDVFGFITINEGIKIHRVNCPNAVQLMSNYAYRIIKAKWTSKDLIHFLAGLKITGIDDFGLVNKITTIISSDQLNVNMKSIFFESKDGIFEGEIMLFVHNTLHLDALIENLLKLEGILSVERSDNE